MMDAKTCLKILEVLGSAFKNAPVADSEQWISSCGNYIKCFEKKLLSGKPDNLSVGEKMRFQTMVVTLHTYCEKFKLKRRQHHGGRLAVAEPEEGHVLWKDVESALKNSNRCSG